MVHSTEDCLKTCSDPVRLLQDRPFESLVVIDWKVNMDTKT